MAEEIDEEIEENLNEEIEEDENIPTPHIWKISYGSKPLKSFSDEERNELRERHLVAIGHDKGTPRYKQSKSEDQAGKEIHEGDYFYLCNDGDVTFRLLGQFITDKAEDCDFKPGWLARQYRIIASAKKDDKEYQKQLQEYFDQKSIEWTPNTHSNTICQVPKEEEEAFEDIILKPYFGITLDELYSGMDFEHAQEENFRKWFSHQLTDKKRNGKHTFYDPKTIGAQLYVMKNLYETIGGFDGYTSIFQIQQADVWDEFKKYFLETPEYKESKEKNEYCGTGLNKYKEFLEGKNTDFSENINENEDAEIALESEDDTTVITPDASEKRPPLDPEKQEKLFRIWMKNKKDEGGNKQFKDTTIKDYLDIYLVKAYNYLYETYKLEYSNIYYVQYASEIIGSYNEKQFKDYANSIGQEHWDNVINLYLDFLKDEEKFICRTILKEDKPHNLIYFGAPGTGKSYMLDKEKDKLIKNGGDYERVTFHPDYSYANFVGTYKPVNDENGDIKYEYVPGSFMRTYVKAMKNAWEVQYEDAEPQPYLLIIEEINRADVAAVFGDVFQLLDRDDDNISEYPIETSEDIRKYLASDKGLGEYISNNPDAYQRIYIPDNMFIWATMNSADQGVFPMDTAFKRRWDFEYIGIDDYDADLKGKKVKLGKNDKEKDIEWNALRKAINDFLAQEGINEDKQLGPYFISRKIVVPDDGKKEIDPKEFIPAFKDKVIMYLFEDAARQHREIFNYSEIDNTATPKSLRYSQICNYFVDNGINIFCDEIKNKYSDYTTQNEN